MHAKCSHTDICIEKELKLIIPSPTGPIIIVSQVHVGLICLFISHYIQSAFAATKILSLVPNGKHLDCVTTF